MTITAAKDLQYSFQAESFRAICRRASIKFGFKRAAESSFLLPHIYLYLTDLGGNRIIFNFINNAPGSYAIKGIHYHDDHLLNAAVTLGHITGSDTEIHNRNARISMCLDQSKVGDSLSGTDFDNTVPNHGGPRLFAYDGSQSESVVNIFDLHNAKGFADIIYALTEGNLYITLQVLEFETRYHRRCINDAMPMF